MVTFTQLVALIVQGIGLHFVTVEWPTPQAEPRK